MPNIVVNPRMNPWKNASRRVGGADNSVIAYVKYVGIAGLAAGSEPDQATVGVAGDVTTFQVAEDGGGLANDTGIAYTGASGAAGTITQTDGNANSVREYLDIINGVGTGQTAFRRWRAAIGDFHPAYVLGAGDLLALAAANALLGRSDEGVSVFADSSALASVNQLNVGIGTSGGAIEGSGANFPDYYEDIPGSSTVASVNTPVRSAGANPRKRQDAIVARKQYRITGFAIQAQFATTELLTVLDRDANTVWEEPLTAGQVTVFQDRADDPILGPVGSPLFVAFTGTGGFTDGSISIRAEERFV